jgi:hypothetical protein
MKKAKLFLAAIAVMGIVGGAVAFKAKTTHFATYYVATTTNVVPTKTIVDAYTVPSTTTTFVTAAYYTTLPGVDATKFAYITTDVNE